MAQRITTNDVRAMLDRVKAAGKVAGVDTDHWTLQVGSPTNGRAWRLQVRDPETGGLSNIPGGGVGYAGYIGWSAREAHAHLSGALSTFYAVEAVQRTDRPALDELDPIVTDVLDECRVEGARSDEENQGDPSWSSADIAADIVQRLVQTYELPWVRQS